MHGNEYNKMDYVKADLVMFYQPQTSFTFSFHYRTDVFLFRRVLKHLIKT